MARTPASHAKSWTPQQLQQLKRLAAENTPTRVIALKLERTPEAVQAKASEEHVSLNPPNQSPYNRR